jgi:phage terminase large subunit
MYSYKVDRLTGDVTDTLIDAYNHYIDAIRYALAPMIKAGGLPMTLSMRTVY